MVVTQQGPAKIDKREEAGIDETIGCGKASPGLLPRGPLGVRILTPQLVGGLPCVGPLSQALTWARGHHGYH